MKRALTILTLAAVPVFAEEPAKKTETETVQPKVLSAAPASEGDSPLVAAARRMNRGRKSAHKITNANLGKYGSAGHITTTARQEPIVMPGPLPESAPTPEMVHAAQRDDARRVAAAAAAKKAKEDAEKKLKAAAAAERNEEGMYGDTDADADYGDGQRDPNAPQPEPKKDEKKPPQG